MGVLACRNITSLLSGGARLSSAASSSKRSASSGGERRSKGRSEKNSPKAFIGLGYPKLKPHEFNAGVEWSSVYQTARPFDPYLIPLAIRMGRPPPGQPPGQVPPPAPGNLELLKIPNFFHLTPPAIEKHCQALKKLCTPWPSQLPSLPLRISTINFISPSHDIRNEKSRKVKLTFSLKDLELSPRSRQKMITLADHRYNSSTDEITLISDQCPTRKQNQEYVLYLMKVLYIESLKHQAWEDEKPETSPV